MQPTNTKYILHGGFVSGNENEDNHAFYEEILKDAPDSTRILLVTFAKDEDGDRISRAITKVGQEFENVKGLRTILISVATKEDFINQIKNSDVIYFHGGVSLKLLEVLRQYPELESVLKGKIVAGESAGANVWCKYFYSRKTDEISEGLGLLPIKLIPHYQEEFAHKLDNIDEALEEVHLPEYQFKVISGFRVEKASLTTESDILALIKNDPWMMKVLETASSLNLPDWMIGAGFVRNKVWDHLHGYSHAEVPTADIDLIYFNASDTREDTEKAYDEQLAKVLDINWSVKNQARMHIKHNRTLPYRDTVEALSEWVETPTCVAVRLEPNGELTLFAPHGIDDLVNLIVRPAPSHKQDLDTFWGRIKSKHWLEKWPKLKVFTK